MKKITCISGISNDIFRVDSDINEENGDLSFEPLAELINEMIDEINKLKLKRKL